LTLCAGAVLPLGHRTYYPRFGFQASAGYGITSEYDAPPEAFMLLELKPGYMRGASGTVKFNAAFADA
jgi:putative acetyltransferase